VSAATPVSAARVYTHLRTADLERFRQMTPARVLFTRTRYDFDESLVDPANPPVRLTRLGVVRELLRREHAVVEMNEPAIGDLFPFLLAQVAAIRLRGLISRRRATIAAYCIQNADPALELARRWRLPRPLARVVTTAAVRILVRSTDRLAVGTAGSFALYRSYVGDRLLRERARLIEEVPSACECLARSTEERIPTQLAFVGVFSERKGIRQAMAAWDAHRADDTEATFRIIGMGVLQSEVVAWAADRPEVSVEIDPPRETIHRVLRQSGALILLSQPVGSFREQVGFPITEGLAHGCEIIASSETGVAGWLAEHGHSVVAPAAPASRVADEIGAAFDRARRRPGSLPELPALDQRIVADRWMFTGAVP
jgi:glycosyltransferase involved in cell wall biosynthesis